MGVKLTPDEIDEFLGASHTLIVATTRKSGEPFMTPIWFVWLDGAFWVRTGGDSAKVKHILNDPRTCCMVEEGEAWADLRAVVASCEAAIIDDPVVTERVQAALDQKYSAFRVQRAALPDATQMHYGSERVIIRFTPREGEIRSWYNRKIRIRDSG